MIYIFHGIRYTGLSMITFWQFPEVCKPLQTLANPRSKIQDSPRTPEQILDLGSWFGRSLQTYANQNSIKFRQSLSLRSYIDEKYIALVIDQYYIKSHFKDDRSAESVDEEFSILLLIHIFSVQKNAWKYIVLFYEELI